MDLFIGRLTAKQFKSKKYYNKRYIRLLNLVHINNLYSWETPLLSSDIVWATGHVRKYCHKEQIIY
jgi:hypothetical protein